MKEKNHLFVRRKPSSGHSSGGHIAPGQEFRVQQLGLDPVFAQQILTFRKPHTQESEDLLSPETEARLYSSLSGGSPLPPDVARYWGAEFAADFSTVRIHTDGEANKLCQLLGANAFAWHGHIWFREGYYNPDSPEGKKLLAHELTHVLQQQGVSEMPLQRKIEQEDQDKILKFFRGRFTKRELWKSLVLLYPYSSDEIQDFWQQYVSIEDTLTLLKRSRWDVFYAFPRELAAIFSSLEADIRLREIQQIFAEPFKKKKGFQDLDAIRVFYLIQGFEKSELDAAVEDGRLSADLLPTVLKKLPDGYRDRLRGAAQTFTKDQEDFSVQAGEAEATTDIAIGREESQELEAIYKRIRKFLHQDRLLGKLTSPYLLRVPSRKAIRAYELLKELPDGRRARFARRYSDLMSLIEFNIPQSYREQPDYGFHRGMPDEEVLQLRDQIADPKNWSGEELTSNRLEILISMAIQAGIGPILVSTVESRITETAAWNNSDQNLRVFSLLLFILVQNVNPDLGIHPSVLSFILTQRDREGFADILPVFGFENGTWVAPEEEKYKEEFGVIRILFRFMKTKNKHVKEERKKKRKEGKDFDREVFTGRVSTNNEAISFFKKGQGELFLEDFSLSDLQTAMGGAVAGVEFLGPDYDDEGNATEGSGSNGNITATINEENAQISATALPFSGISYEGGTYGFKAGPGHFNDLTATFCWIAGSGMELGNQLVVNELEFTNLRIIDPQSTIGIGKLKITGLEVKLNQPIGEPEEVYGGYGMNLIFGLTDGINQMIYLAMNSLMVAVERLLPQAGLDSGEALSKQLLEDLGNNPEFELKFSSVEVLNVFSNAGLVLGQVSLGASRLSIGGKLADYYQQKAEELKKVSPQTVETIGRIAYYESLVLKEKDSASLISSLEAELAALAEDQTLRRQQILFELGELKSLQSLKLSILTEEVKIDDYPVPEGEFEVIGGLDTFGYGKTEEEREAKKLELLTRASEGVLAPDSSKLSGDFLFVETNELSIGSYEQFTQGWIGGKIKMLDEQWIFEFFLPYIETEKWPDLAEYGILLSPLDPGKPCPLTLTGITVSGVLQLNKKEEQTQDGIAIRAVELNRIKIDYLELENLQLKAAGQVFDFKGQATLSNAQIQGVSIGLTEDYKVSEVDLSAFVFTTDSFGGSQAMAQVAGMVNVNLPYYEASGIKLGAMSGSVTDEKTGITTTSKGYFFAIDSFIGEGQSFTYDSQKLKFDNLTNLEGTWLNYKETKPEATSETNNYDVLQLSFELESLGADKLAYGKKGDSFQLRTTRYKSDPDDKDVGFAYFYGLFADMELRFKNPSSSEVKAAEAEGKEPPKSYLDSFLLKKLSADQISVNNLVAVYKGKTYKIVGDGDIWGFVLNGVLLDFNQKGNFSFAFQPKGGVVLDSSFFEKVTDTFSNITNLSTGKVEFRRLSTKKGYYYEVNDLSGDLEYYDTKGKPNTDPKNVFTYANALFGGRGATVKGTYMDDQSIYADFSIPDDINIPRLYWKDGKGNYFYNEEGGHTLLRGITGELYTKLTPKGSKNPLEYIKIKWMRIQEVNSTGLHLRATIKGGNYDIALPVDAPAKLYDMWLTNINYNFGSGDFTGDINVGNLDVTADIEKAKSPIIGLLKGQPRLMADELNFSMNDEGTIDISVMSMGVFLPAAEDTDAMSAKKGYFAKDDLRFYFASSDGALPVLSSGTMHFRMETAKDHGKDENFNLAIQDPMIRDLFVSFEDLLGVYKTHFAGIMLDGQAIGELSIVDTDKELIISVSGIVDREEGPKPNEGFLEFPSAKLWTKDLWQMIQRNKKAPDPNATPPEPVTEENYENTGYFDFLNEVTGGTLEIDLWGETFTLPITTVRADILDYQNGFVDMNDLIDQIRTAYDNDLLPEIDEAHDAEGGFWANLLRNSWNIWALEAKRDGAQYVIESSFNYNIMVLLPNTYRNVYNDYDTGVEYMRLAPFLDYMINGPSEEGPDNRPLPTKLGETSADNEVLAGMEPGVRVRDLEFNLDGWDADDERRGPFKDWLVDSEDENVRMSIGISIDTSPYDGPGRIPVDYHGSNTTYANIGDPHSKFGIDLTLSDIYFPGFQVDKDLESGPYKKIEASGSQISIEEGSVAIEDLRMQDTQIEVSNVKVYGFTLKLTKK